jgi:hypothetical protein
LVVGEIAAPEHDAAAANAGKPLWARLRAFA